MTVDKTNKLWHSYTQEHLMGWKINELQLWASTRKIKTTNIK